MTASCLQLAADVVESELRREVRINWKSECASMPCNTLSAATYSMIGNSSCSDRAIRDRDRRSASSKSSKRAAA